MNKLILAGIFTFTGDLVAEQDKALGEITTLQLIDNACGDIWCEGDFDFNFKSFNCRFDKEICTLEYEYIWNIYSPETDETTSDIRKHQKCIFENIRTIEDIRNDESTTRPRLSVDFIARLSSECINFNLDSAYDLVDRLSRP